MDTEAITFVEKKQPLNIYIPFCLKRDLLRDSTFRNALITDGCSKLTGKVVFGDCQNDTGMGSGLEPPYVRRTDIYSIIFKRSKRTKI